MTSPLARTPAALRRWLLVVLVLTTPIVALAAGYAWLKHGFLLSFVPDALHVRSIVYEKEERWGLPLLALPGDNETGLRIYALPDAIAANVADGGIGWLQGMPPNAPSQSRDLRGVYTEWHETPLDQAARGRMTSVSTGPAGECGFCIQVDPAVWAEVQAIVDAPGSYYAMGRSGVIVVSPARRRVLFMFSG